MSMREEDREERQKNNCPSRGLGLAAAALGVGVGAALYYFLSKKPENPDGEGSTTGWACEQSHAFNFIYDDESNTSMENQCGNSSTSLEDSYTTVSETTTTDTSVYDSSDTDSQASEGTADSEDYIDLMPDFQTDVSDDWDVTDSSLDVPSDDWRAVSPVRMLINRFGTLFSPRPSQWRNRRNRSQTEHRELLRAQALSKEEYIKFLKAEKFRERTWSLEECSICFEIMLKDQQLTSLPCSHNFHSACLAPWLEEQQTCPNCRKAAE